MKEFNAILAVAHIRLLIDSSYTDDNVFLGGVIF